MTVLCKAVYYHNYDISPQELGSPSIKSIETSCQACSATTNGCNSPGGLQIFALLILHVSHSYTKTFIAFSSLENKRNFSFFDRFLTFPNALPHKSDACTASASI